MSRRDHKHLRKATLVWQEWRHLLSCEIGVLRIVWVIQGLLCCAHEIVVPRVCCPVSAGDHCIGTSLCQLPETQGAASSTHTCRNCDAVKADKFLVVHMMLMTNLN